MFTASLGNTKALKDMFELLRPTNKICKMICQNKGITIEYDSVNSTAITSMYICNHLFDHYQCDLVDIMEINLPILIKILNYADKDESITFATDVGYYLNITIENKRYVIFLILILALMDNCYGCN